MAGAVDVGVAAPGAGAGAGAWARARARVVARLLATPSGALRQRRVVATRRSERRQVRPEQRVEGGEPLGPDGEPLQRALQILCARASSWRAASTVRTASSQARHTSRASGS